MPDFHSKTMQTSAQICAVSTSLLLILHSDSITIPTPTQTSTARLYYCYHSTTDLGRLTVALLPLLCSQAVLLLPIHHRPLQPDSSTVTTPPQTDNASITTPLQTSTVRQHNYYHSSALSGSSTVNHSSTEIHNPDPLLGCCGSSLCSTPHCVPRG